MRAPRHSRAGAMFLALATAACAGSQATPAAAPAPSGVAAAPAPANPGTLSTAEVEALYRARLDSARMRWTPADVHFMTGMIHHHAQALVMAAMAPTHGAGPGVLTLAARITNAQKDEIATMQQWLRERAQPIPELHEMGGQVMVMGPMSDMRMPGMLTPEQLSQLDRARGPEFDRLFLTGMIQHHSGAVSMVKDLFGTDGAGQDEAVFKFASDVQVDQTTEIARMQKMLAVLQPAGSPPALPR